jgi:hypothetical protein
LSSERPAALPFPPDLDGHRRLAASAFDGGKQLLSDRTTPST